MKPQEKSNKAADIMVAKDRERIPMHEPFTWKARSAVLESVDGRDASHSPSDAQGH